MAVANMPRPTLPQIVGGIVFLVAAVVSGSLVWTLEQHAVSAERMRVANEIDDHIHEIESTLNHTLSAAYALGAQVRQGKGHIPDFDAVASAMLPYYPGASALALAPAGIVSDMAPRRGNEKAIGLDLLNTPALRKESVLARDSGKLTLAGPLQLAMGGTGIVGRLPVFLEDDRGHAVFWGFVVVVMRLSGELGHLSHFGERGLAYELWRIQPDSGHKQIIARAAPAPLINPVEQGLRVPNANWVLSAVPLKGWGYPLERSLEVLFGFLFSLILGYLAYLLVVLRTHKQRLEASVARRTAEILVAQHKLRAMFDAIPDLVWLKDADSVYLSCNPMFERLLGAREADIAGKTDYDLFDREQADFFRDNDRKAIAAGKPRINEEWLTSAADGVARLFEVIKTPIADEAGTFIGVLGIGRDVTARTQAERALREAQQRAQQYLNIVGVMLIALDTEGRVQLVNRKGCEILGAPEAEILGKDWFEHFQPERMRQELRAAFVRMLEDNAVPVEYMENTILTRRGEERVMAGHNVLLRDEAGRVSGLLSSGEDVTESRRAERALRDSRERLQLLLDSMAEAAYGVDLDGNCTFVNRAFLTILNYPDENEVLGKHIHSLIHHSHADGSPYPASECQMYRAYRDKQAINVSDEVFWRRDGTAIPVEYWSRPIVKDGAVVGAIATFIDITERKRSDQALRDSRERIHLLLDSMAEGAYGVDFDGNCSFVNRAFLRILDYQDENELLGKPIHALIHHSHADGSPYPSSECPMHRANLSYVAINVTDEVFWRRDGTAIPVEYWSNPVIADGVVVGAVVTFIDITERKRAETQLALAAQVFEQSGEGILITDSRHRIIMVNQAFTTITGYSEAEALGQDPRMLASGRHDEAFYRAMWEAIVTQGRWQGEIWNRRKDGGLYQEFLSVIRVLDAQGAVAHYIGISSDITQHKEAEARIQQLAHFDPLTGLPNRALLGDRARHDLSTAQRKHTPLAIMFADLDHFKNVNDTLGHRIGDKLLIAVATRLKTAVREVDTVSRQGGDEFVLLLPDTDADGVAHVAGKLLAAIEQPYQIDGFELSVTLSVGIALYPGDGEDFEVLSKCADAAMYRAKHDGRNTYRFFTTEMQTHSAHTLQMENALHRALERNQLLLHYQPQIALDDGRIVGVEALLRWQHPELGMIAPADFIPIAEESGQILPIGEWALRSAVQQMKAWIDSGLAPMPMAVNLSAVQFRHPHLPERVTQILDEAKLAPQYLELELTESIAMGDAPAAIAVMDRLHVRGVRMSIDDFGTGYSSLSYLKRFKVHRLKIDQSFVRGIGEDPEDRAIVVAIISLANSLGMRTIAEGVETEAQLAFLRAQGCSEVQGFYYSKALPADQFEAFVRAGYPSAWRVS